jgi:hypothetical protein
MMESYEGIEAQEAPSFDGATIILPPSLMISDIEFIWTVRSLEVARLALDRRLTLAVV